MARATAVMNVSGEAWFQQGEFSGNSTYYYYDQQNYTLHTPLQPATVGGAKPVACEQLHIAVEVCMPDGEPPPLCAPFCLDLLLCGPPSVCTSFCVDPLLCVSPYL